MCRRYLRYFVIFVLSAITFALCSGLDASADALSGGRYLTTDEARTIFGETIEFEYYNGSAYVTATAAYSGTGTINLVYSEGSHTAVTSGAPFLKYYATSVNYKPEAGYITVKAKPAYSVIDTQQLHSFIAVSSHKLVSSSFQSPQWDWSCGHYENSATDGASQPHQAYFTINGSTMYYTFCEADYTSESKFSAFCGNADFNGNSHNGYQNVSILIGIPYVSDDSNFQSGTIATSSGSSDVNVNVDMSETNGLLGWIFDGISGIPDAIMSGIRSIFVPDSEYVVNKIVEMRDYFAWYDEFSRVGQIFKTHFQTTSGEAPVVRITGFSTASGTYLSTNEYVLDMAPFEDYLPSIKTVISVWLWVTFLWSLYCRLPDIINGAGILVFNQHKIDNWRSEQNDKDCASDISDSIDTFHPDF